MLSWVVSLFTGSPERVICVALLLGLVASCTLYSCEKEARQIAETNAAIAVQVNEANVAAATKLQQWQSTVDKAVEKVAADKKEIDELRQELRSGIRQVLKSNADARAWADTVIPPDFIRLFNAANSNATTANRHATKP